jgi:hypothetical protein
VDGARREKQLAIIRKVLSISLSFIILLQCSMKLIIVAQFESNRKYISQNLCENRNKPKSNCRGKCYLKKQLKKEDKNESANNLLKAKSETLFVQEIISPVFTYFSLLEKPLYSYLFFESLAHSKEKLQPPEIENSYSA